MGRRVLLLAGVLLSSALGAFLLDSLRTEADTTALPLGWNNVAYLGPSGPPSEVLAPHADKYSAIYRWNAETQAYEVYAPGMPAFAATLTELRTGDAVWLNVTAPGLTLPQAASAPASGALSIPASAFFPASDLAMYEKSFNQLYPVSTDHASQRYYALVSLPDGVTVTSMTAAFEATAGEVKLRLDFTPLANGSSATQVFKLAEVLSTNGRSPQTVSAYPHVVDNTANVYFLVVDLTGGPSTKLFGVSIAYEGS